MNLKIIRIIDRGVPNKERLHLLVQADANLNYYVVFDTEYVTGGIASLPKHAYWFVDHPVKAGDHVILYTGTGTPSVKPRTDGHKNHFFYWDLNSTIWRTDKACAVLIEVTTWETSATV